MQMMNQSVLTENINHSQESIHVSKILDAIASELDEVEHLIGQNSEKLAQVGKEKNARKVSPDTQEIIRLIDENVKTANLKIIPALNWLRLNGRTEEAALVLEMLTEARAHGLVEGLSVKTVGENEFLTIRSKTPIVYNEIQARIRATQAAMIDGKTKNLGNTRTTSANMQTTAGVRVPIGAQR